MAVRTTERTHDDRGVKTMSQIHRDHEAWRDEQPTVTRCNVYLCDWFHSGTAAEGRDAFVAHRTSEHPTAVRAAKGLEKYERKPGGERRRRPAKATRPGTESQERAKSSIGAGAARSSDPDHLADVLAALPAKQLRASGQAVRAVSDAFSPLGRAERRVVWLVVRGLIDDAVGLR